MANQMATKDTRRSRGASHAARDLRAGPQALCQPRQGACQARRRRETPTDPIPGWRSLQLGGTEARMNPLFLVRSLRRRHVTR